MRALVFAGIVAAACGDNRTIDSSGELAISAIHFGRVVTHGSGTATVANTTSVAVALGAISVTGDGFAVQATTCGAMLDANASCEITVDLAGAHLGAANGTLEVAGVRAALDATFADVVAVSATGGGRITSSPGGIDCGATCSAVFDAPVTLTATPDAGRGFGGWSDPTCGSATTCTITTARNLSATFAAGVTIAPIHLGTVTVADSGTAVLTNALVTPVTLSSVTFLGPFTAKSGGTCGSVIAAGTSCTIVVGASAPVLGPIAGHIDVAYDGTNTASAPIDGTFAETVSVAIAGDNGSVTSSPAGIACGTTCAATFAAPVTLTAQPGPGQTFTGWSEASCGTATTCVIAAPHVFRPVTAYFGPALVIRFAGNAPAEASSIPSGIPVSCNSLPAGGGACVVPLAVGTSTTVAASTPSDYLGMTGACTTSSNQCSITTATTATITVTAQRDAHESLSIYVPPFPAYVDSDSHGNLFVGLEKRDPTGLQTLWVYQAGRVVTRATPDDGILYWTGSELVKLSGDGDVLWRAPVGTGLPLPPENVSPHMVDVNANGDVAVTDAKMLWVFHADGTPWWSVALSIGLGSFPYAFIDNAGDAAVANDDPAQTELDWFDTTGAPLKTQLIAFGDTHFQSYAIDSAGLPAAAFSDFHTVDVTREGATGNVFTDLIPISSPSAQGGICGITVATNNDVWVAYGLDWPTVGYGIRHYGPAGAILQTITRPGFNLAPIGFVGHLQVHDVRSTHDGGFLVGSEFNVTGGGGIGTLQIFRP